MPLKRQIQTQYKYFLQYIYAWKIPAWLNCRLVRVGLVIIILFCSTGYVIKTASSASTGYQINALEKNLNTLQEEIRKIEVTIAEESSMTSVHERLEGMGMVAVNEFSFYEETDKKVAKK